MSRRGLSITMDIRVPIEPIETMGRFAVVEHEDRREVYIDNHHTTKRVEQLILKLLDDQMTLHVENSHLRMELEER